MPMVGWLVLPINHSLIKCPTGLTTARKHVVVFPTDTPFFADASLWSVDIELPSILALKT